MFEVDFVVNKVTFGVFEIEVGSCVAADMVGPLVTTAGVVG